MTADEGAVTVRVRICGEEHAIRGDASSEYIKQLARKVDSQMRAVQQRNPNLTRYRVAILAAINIADELEKVKAEYQELLQIMEEAN